MKVALVAARIVDRDVGHSLLQMERYMKAAKAQGADLVCFGEAFLQGFNALTWRYEEDCKVAIATSSQTFGHIKALSKEIGVDVLFGYNELSGDSIYSSCALIAGGELLHNYRRISKGWKEYWKTDAHYKEGTAVEVFAYRGRKCTIGLCGDLWDEPQRFDLGQDVLFWPVYVCWTEEEWENGGKQEYAQQAEMCCGNTLYVNSICEGDAFGGAAHFADGAIASELPVFHEGVLYVTLS